jgi:hypothetical protein
MIDLVVMAIRERGGGPQNRAANAALNYSTALVQRLHNTPGETQKLIRSLTYLCASEEVGNINNWQRKLESIPAQFYFSNCNVSYRQLVSGGVLLVTECIMTPQWTTQHWRTEGTSSVLNAVFFVAENTATGKYEVRSLHPTTAQQKGTVTLFGIQFLEVVSKLDTTVRQALPPQADQNSNKSWWKRMFSH